MGSEYINPPFLTLAIDGVEWSAGLDAVEKRNISYI
jgi:hypothetical protein